MCIRLLADDEEHLVPSSKGPQDYKTRRRSSDAFKRPKKTGVHPPALLLALPISVYGRRFVRLGICRRNLVRQTRCSVRVSQRRQPVLNFKIFFRR